MGFPKVRVVKQDRNSRKKELRQGWSWCRARDLNKGWSSSRELTYEEVWRRGQERKQS